MANLSLVHPEISFVLQSAILRILLSAIYTNTRINNTKMSASSINREELIEIINKAHNPSLVDKTETMSPTENTIYHLYGDGEITEQKGSWAYTQRSERTVEYPFQAQVYLHYSLFPLYKKMAMNQIFPYGGGVGYIICTQSDAYRIRKILQDYYKATKIVIAH